MKPRYLKPACLLTATIWFVVSFTVPGAEAQFEQRPTSPPSAASGSKQKGPLNKDTRDASTPLGNVPDRSMDSSKGYTGKPGTLPGTSPAGDPKVKDLSGMDAGISGPGTPGGSSPGR